ncbi:MAG TPA: hypothetical protein VKU40_09630, partial [Thermoanaerobaculia bacterium]|nr:hypothetical protein [Thermoanaerobaculia bacterium]
MSRRLFLFLGFLFLASTCEWAPSAGAQNTKNCAVDSSEVYNVGFTELSNQPEGLDCINFYRCYLAEQPAGPFLRKFDPACDP